MTWPRVKLETLAAPRPYALVGGPFGSRLTSRDYTDSGVPVIRGTNLGRGKYLSLENFVYVSDAKVARDLTGNLAHAGDLIFTQRGTLGQVAIVPEHSPFERYVVSQSQMKMTVNPAKVDAEFLYYYFSSHEAIQRIINYTSSSGVPHINLSVLRNFEVPLPPVQIQQRIARLLATYDELIENNRRRIELLERAARMLYKEWFVDLRFPGHERVPVKDGVPEGWDRVELSNLCQHVRESVDPTELPPEVPYIGLEHMPRRSITLGAWGLAGDVVSAKFKFGHRDILFGRIRPYFHKVGFGITPGITSADVIVLRQTEEPLYFYALMLVSSDEFINLASKTVREGSRMPRADWGYLSRCLFHLPPVSILERFGEIVKPIINQLEKLARQNRKLAQARDLLLPRLMNGEIAV